MTTTAQEIVEIISLSHDGRGIASIQGKKIFIDGALPGEQVEFIYIKRHSNFDEGRVIRVLQPSPVRVTPACRHYGVCGGCQLQHLSHEQQLALKQQTFLEQVAQFGRAIPDEILPPILGTPYHYRGRARLSAKFVQKKNALVLGFHEKNGRFITDMQECPILPDTFSKKILDLRQCIQSLSICQHIPQIEVAFGGETCALVIRNLLPLSASDQTALTAFARDNQFHIYLQPKGPTSTIRLWPAPSEVPYGDYLEYELPEEQVQLKFHPNYFTQINQGVNRKMVRLAIELLDLREQDQVLDLYCGLGNFSLPMARKSGKVIGIEGSDALVKLAQYNAHINHINNAEFYIADLNENINNKAFAKQKYDKILLDPPRSGAHEIVQSLSKFKAERIVYVACNPATFARDVSVLSQHGYRLAKAGILDMFPQTRHIESIALLLKK